MYIEQIDLKPIADGTITDKKKLAESIRQAKKDGYTVSHSELENYSSAISAPIFNHQGEVVAGISIAGIEAYYHEENIPGFAKKVEEAANEIRSEERRG